MLGDDDLDRLLRGGDPVSGARSVALADPEGAAAQRILGQARRRFRRGRVRRIVVVPVAAAALAGASAGTTLWVAGDGEGHALDTIAVDCEWPESGANRAAFDILSETPVEACQRVWAENGHPPPPTPLIACVDSSRQGSIKVYQGGPEECARHRADPYAGPTEEQLRFAEFRADLADRFAGRTCVSYPDLREAITELFATHGLSGWTVRNHETLEGPKPEGQCAEIVYYDEPGRTAWLVDHLSGTPMDWP